VSVQSVLYVAQEPGLRWAVYNVALLRPFDDDPTARGIDRDREGDLLAAVPREDHKIDVERPATAHPRLSPGYVGPSAEPLTIYLMLRPKTLENSTTAQGSDSLSMTLRKRTTGLRWLKARTMASASHSFDAYISYRWVEPDDLLSSKAYKGLRA
jgi:hypothetical protein